MSVPRNSRGKKILALLNKGSTTNEEVVQNEISENLLHDNEENNDDLSSSSSSDKESHDDTYCEDSDDSVKDPNYTPPEPSVLQDIDDLFLNGIDRNASPPTNSQNVIAIPSTSSRNIEYPPSPKAKIVRKRKQNEASWRRNVIKKLRNTGRPYISSSNKIRQERKMKEPCGEKCRLKCRTIISEDERKILFDNYWALGGIKVQWEYISKSMTIITPKYRYIREGGTRKPRNKNHAFYFNLPDKTVRVCKTFFKNTLDINDRPIRTVLDKEDKVANCLLADDKRGKHNKHPKVDDVIKDSIRDYIKDIPKIESHYTRAHTTRVFIDGSKNIADIYSDYVEAQKQKNQPYGNYVMFYKIFTQEFNISFFTPKKDICDVCFAYENSDDKENRKDDHDKHLKEKRLCREEKFKDKEDENVIVAVYDLQAVFQCPKGDVSLFYYKCKLNVLNFTICDLKTNKVECYVWDESNANRGVNDLGTCVYKYIEKVSLLNNEREVNLVFYSDNCVGQQKNKVMVAIYIFALQKIPNLQSITHKFLIKGHTQNEGDAVHSLIERQVKKLLKAGPMYSPEAFISAIKSARKKPEPLHVNEMCTEDFVDWKDACTQMTLNLTKNEEGDPVKITNIKLLRVEKDKPRLLFYKNSYEEKEYKKAIIIRKRKPIDVRVTKSYECKPGISDKKKSDLIDLLNKNLIPRFYAPFYNAL